MFRVDFRPFFPKRTRTDNYRYYTFVFSVVKHTKPVHRDLRVQTTLDIFKTGIQDTITLFLACEICNQVF